MAQVYGVSDGAHAMSNSSFDDVSWPKVRTAVLCECGLGLCVTALQALDSCHVGAQVSAVTERLRAILTCKTASSVLAWFINALTLPLV